MKRTIVASSAAAVLALAMLPGSAAAVMPGDLDQSVGVGAVPVMYTANATVTQTFTPGVTGSLTHIELYCGGGAGTVNVDLYVGPYHVGSGPCSSTAGWVDFILPHSQLMAAGSQGTLRIVVPASVLLGEAASGYAGGAAGDQAGNPIVVADFAFRTYVYPEPAITGVWGPSSVPAGVSTPATLTVTTEFAAVPSDPMILLVYTFGIAGLPPYFAAADQMTCSPQIGVMHCLLPNYQSGFVIGGGPLGAPATVTITVTGVLSPPAGEAGAALAVQAESCVHAQDQNFPTIELTLCGHSDADLRIGDAATPPPTATTGGSGSSGAGLLLWWLPAGLAALLGSLLTIRRQGKLIR